MVRFVRNIVILSIALFLLQSLIYHWRVQVEFPLIERIRETGNGSIILFGDSSIGHFDREDEDTRTITELLNDKIRNDSVVGWDNPAFDMRVYDVMIDYIREKDLTSGLVIIPVNMRSFSRMWYLRPEWQFTFEKDALQSNWMTPVSYALKPFMTSDDLFLLHFRNTELQVSGESIGIVGDFRGEEYREVTPDKTKKKLLANYMYSLKDDPYGVEQVIRICQNASEAGIDLFFYITPLPVYEGEQLIGPEFNRIVSSNTDTIVKVVNRYGYVIADWHDLLESDQFSKDDPYKREHYSWEGKQVLTDSLAARISHYSTPIQ